MIYILSLTIKKHEQTISRLLHSKLKKIQNFPKNLRTFQDCPQTLRNMASRKQKSKSTADLPKVS